MEHHLLFLPFYFQFECIFKFWQEYNYFLRNIFKNIFFQLIHQHPTFISMNSLVFKHILIIITFRFQFWKYWCRLEKGISWILRNKKSIPYSSEKLMSLNFSNHPQLNKLFNCAFFKTYIGFIEILFKQSKLCSSWNLKLW